MILNLTVTLGLGLPKRLFGSGRTGPDAASTATLLAALRSHALVALGATELTAIS